VPPLSLWATKEEVLAGADGAALRIVGLAASAVSAVYAARVLAVLLARPTGREPLDDEEAGTRRVPVASIAVAGVLAMLAAGLGVLALPPVASALADVLGAEGSGAPEPLELVAGGLLALVALGTTLAVVTRRPAVVRALERSPLRSWAGLGHLLSPRPALAVARALATVDDRVIDRAVLATAGGVRRVAALLSGADRRVVDGAVRGTARAFRRAGAAARRPQTGLLHQYYVQAATGLGLLLVLLLAVR
jgi:hypothetical protein